jgi:hypothetical protein
LFFAARQFGELDQALSSIEKECGENGLTLTHQPHAQEAQEQVWVSQDLYASAEAIRKQGIRAVDDCRGVCRPQHCTLAGFVTGKERREEFASAGTQRSALVLNTSDSLYVCLRDAPDSAFAQAPCGFDVFEIIFMRAFR